ncbi:MAG: type II toxin-antitoxin system VapB family antitoxin [Acidiferrobacter sp.]
MKGVILVCHHNDIDLMTLRGLAMAALTIRDVPETLHAWLKSQARVHRRSVNQEVIALLERLQGGDFAPVTQNPEDKVAAIMAISRRCAALPVQDKRSEDEILGYDQNGVPESLWSSTPQH